MAHADPRFDNAKSVLGHAIRHAFKLEIKTSGDDDKTTRQDDNNNKNKNNKDTDGTTPAMAEINRRGNSRKSAIFFDQRLEKGSAQSAGIFIFEKRCDKVLTKMEKFIDYVMIFCIVWIRRI